MNWFTRFCRQSGLMIHQIVQPDRKNERVIASRKHVEEKQDSPAVILRRTTIEEIEVKDTNGHAP